jgi:hypothetical protein
VQVNPFGIPFCLSSQTDYGPSLFLPAAASSTQQPSVFDFLKFLFFQLVAAVDTTVVDVAT